MKILFSAYFILIYSLGFSQNSIPNNHQKEGIINIVSYEEMPITNIEAIEKSVPKEYQEMTKNLKQVPKYYDLLFNDTEALYKKSEKKAEAPEDLTAGNIRMKETVISVGGISEMYKNFKTNSSLASRSILDKVFLVQENLQKIEWTLINETKTIGNLECKKAQAKIGDFMIEAWYAPSIPTMAGPSVYWGLPGLIIELKTKTQHYMATQIKENTAGTITMPTKGKKISPEEFTKLVSKSTDDYIKGMSPTITNTN
jgi:GLPGLI family protein